MPHTIDAEEHRKHSDEMRAMCKAAGKPEGEKQAFEVLDALARTYLYGDVRGNPDLAFRFGVMAGLEFMIHRSLAAMESGVKAIASDEEDEHIVTNLGAACLVAATGPRFLRWSHAWVNKVFPRRITDNEPLPDLESPIALVKELRDVLDKISKASGGRVKIAEVNGNDPDLAGLLAALKGEANSKQEEPDAPGMYL